MSFLVGKNLVEIRFHGRGGQGAVTAAHILVDSAVREGLWGVAFPFFGAERRGAPVTAYARLSRSRIYTRTMIRSPDVVVVLDPYLINLVNVFEGIKVGGIAVLNNPREMPRIPEGVRTFGVNATRIALELGLVLAGWPLVNVAMVGALARILGISLERVVEAIHTILSGRAAELNAEAARRAYAEVREVAVV